MRKILVTLGILAALAGSARADFVLNNTNLSTSKQDLFPLQPGSNPNNFVTAADYNAATQASLDLRSAITAGSYLGLHALSADPAARTNYPSANYLWYKNDGTLHFFNGSDNTISLGSGLSFPLTNGTSTNTYNSAVTDGASAVGHSFDTTNAFTTDGDAVFRVRSAGSDWLKLERASSARKFTLIGDADATGAGPLRVQSVAGSAGITLDATAGGGRKYGVYSASTGVLAIADFTAGANRWGMDSNGAISPFADNAYNLGLPGARPGGFYTYAADLLGSYTQNIASVTGQQANLSVIASTAATSSGTQSNSPGILLRSQAWNTSALAGQAFDFLLQVVPTAGGANPVTGQLSLFSQANAGGWTERFRITPTRATALNGFVVTQGSAFAYRTAASTITVTNTDRFIGVTGTGARTVNLPAGSTCLNPGQEFVIQEVGNDVGTITINRSGSDTLNGATTATISAAFGAKTLVCSQGTAWYVR